MCRVQSVEYSKSEMWENPLCILHGAQCVKCRVQSAVGMAQRGVGGATVRRNYISTNHVANHFLETLSVVCFLCLIEAEIVAFNSVCRALNDTETCGTRSGPLMGWSCCKSGMQCIGCTAHGDRHAVGAWMSTVHSLVHFALHSVLGESCAS